ncbi:MAG: hypothetical protein HYV19_03760 [Gemmatimonadetes bacterium]|nr:hypothetical protein [Gemmatimonadota bacterium]
MRRTWSVPLLGAAMLASFSIAACAKNDLTGSGGPLTPARNLAGTWKNAIPITVYYQTDFCSNRKETIGQADWLVTFVITKTSDPNTVNVSMSATSSNFVRTSSSCGNGSNGYVPNVWPTTLTGNVSSTSLVATQSTWGMTYDGSFTTDLMQGTWNHWECIVYCTGEYTETNAMKLIRQ